MARTFTELLVDLFRTNASVGYDKLKEAVARRNENLAARGLYESTVRVQAITQMVVDCYEAVLANVVHQLQVPAEAIGIRTQDDAALLVNQFGAEAEALRARWLLKRDKMLANVNVNWTDTDEYDRKTTDLKNRATAAVSLHVRGASGFDAKQREVGWKRLSDVVDTQIGPQAAAVEGNARSQVRVMAATPAEVTGQDHTHASSDNSVAPPTDRDAASVSNEAPESVPRFLLHLIWPKRRPCQIAVATALAVAFVAFAVWSSLPDRTKEAALDHLRGQLPQGTSSSIALLPNDFVLDLSNPYERSPITVVTVQVSVSESVIPLREASLISLQYDSASFAPAPSSVRLVLVTPSAPTFSPGQPGRITLEFEASALIPYAYVTSSFPKGERRPFGAAEVRLWFRNGETRWSEDVTIPLVFEKRHDP